MKYTKELLEPIVKSSITWAECCRKLGKKESTGSQSYIKIVCIKFDLDYSHFLGKSFSKGKISNQRKDALERCKPNVFFSSHKLKNLLIRDGYKDKKCECCGITEWMGEECVLELHHVDGDNYNNSFDNLEVLCPNCHAIKTRKSGRREIRTLTLEEQ